MLRRAGVLVDTDGSHLNIRGAEPKAVSFFHDSIQSYLTARGLHNDGEDTTVLWQAAGDERFLGALTDEQVTSQSELFKMCVEVFENKERLLKQMGSDLLKWADQYGGDITLNKVLEAVPSSLRNQTRALVSDDHGAGFALKKAVCCCLGHLDCETDKTGIRGMQVKGNNLQDLARLYSGIAPITWKLDQETGSAGT